MKYYSLFLMMFLSSLVRGQIRMTHLGPSDKPLYNIVLIKDNNCTKSKREGFVSTIALTSKRYKKVSNLLLKYKFNKPLEDSLQYDFGAFWIQLENKNIEYVIANSKMAVHIFEEIINIMESDGEEKLSTELRRTITRIGQ